MVPLLGSGSARMSHMSHNLYGENDDDATTTTNQARTTPKNEMKGYSNIIPYYHRAGYCNHFSIATPPTSA